MQMFLKLFASSNFSTFSFLFSLLIGRVRNPTKAFKVLDFTFSPADAGS